MTKIRVNAIYPAWQGEQNIKGIGAPCVFLRLAGCHIRCYKETLGILCDTPEALEKISGTLYTLDEIIDNLNNQFDSMGFPRGSSKRTVALSGGDPLARPSVDLHALFDRLSAEHFTVTVETSGTIDVTPYNHYPTISFILDYKLASAGVKNNLVKKIANRLSSDDFVKFVVYDEADYAEMKEAVEYLAERTTATLCVGPFWGGKIPPLELFNKLCEDGLLPKVTMNFQTHKMAVSSNYDTEIPQKI